jgi:hypothetical protein
MYEEIKSNLISHTNYVNLSANLMKNSRLKIEKRDARALSSESVI